MDMATMLKEIKSWPVDDRIEFMQLAWDQLVDSGWQPELTDAQMAEIDRRIAAHEQNPNDVVTWDSMMEHVRRKR